MTILIFTFGILLAIGLFLISADLLKLPSIATQKAMLSAGKQGKEKAKAKTVDVLLMGWAVKFAKYIPMDEYKKSRMKNTLNAAGMNLTPEEFISSAILKSGTIAILIIPCLMILPLIAPILMFLSIIIYFKEIRKADEILKIRKKKLK